MTNINHYKSIPESIQLTTQIKLCIITQTLYEKKYITSKQKDFLTLLTLLPKIHKEPQTWTIPFEVPPGRPIVSDCNNTTCNISQFIDHYLGPLSTRHPSYLNDTYDFLDKIRPMTVPTSSHLFTVDIDSLYTNIHTQTGLNSIKNIFQNQQHVLLQ